MSAFGVFSVGGGAPRVGRRDGEEVVDLSSLGEAFRRPSLNELMSRGPSAWEDAVGRASGLDAPRVSLADVTLHLPFEVADYVDFNSSLEHARNAGRILRGSDEVRPNWRALPVGYHGRAGTVVVSGTEVVRPCGQRSEGDFGPTERLDVELELGFVVGVPTRLGETVPVDAFAEHVFGIVLVNDWSARDLQAWEYVPLGPFLGKSFQTSVSAWVVPLALLGDRRVEAPPQEPPPLPQLAGARDWALDLDVELEVNGEILSRGNARTLYWTMPQQLAHATSNGASLRTGDLFATGTISGPERGSEGSLLERFENGRYLADGDEVVMRARGGRVDLEVRGRVQSARASRP